MFFAGLFQILACFLKKKLFHLHECRLFFTLSAALTLSFIGFDHLDRI